MANASAAPVPDRDATVTDDTPSQDQNLHVGAPESSTLLSPQLQHQEQEDLSAVQWYYRDPGGQEQGIYLPLVVLGSIADVS